MIDRLTPLGEISGYYRSTLVRALKIFEKEVEKTRKAEDNIEGETDHLDEREEIISQFLTLLGARMDKSITDTPIGRAMREGETRNRAAVENPDQLKLGQIEPDGVDLKDDSVITMMLDLASYRRKPDEIAAAVKLWDIETRRLVYLWSRAMQLAGSPGVRVKVPTRPEVVLLDWLDSEAIAAIQRGMIDPVSQAAAPSLSGGDIATWLARGPWAPALKDDGKSWTLRYNATGNEPADFMRPVYEFTHDDEGTAMQVAAIINRRIAIEAGMIFDVEPELSEAEIEELVAAGPWLIAGPAAEGERYTLYFDPARAEEGTEPPVDTRGFDDEASARIAAATANRAVREGVSVDRDDPEVTVTLIALVTDFERDGVNIDKLRKAVADLTPEERQAIEAYCGAAHVNASDHDDVVVPERPGILNVVLGKATKKKRAPKAKDDAAGGEAQPNA